jgi:hypothetical protein
MVIMWWLMRGGDTLPALIAGYPGYFLPAVLELEGVWLILSQLVVGAAIMMGAGLFQDWLRVSPRWAWMYATGPVLGVVFWFAGMGLLWADLLFWGCIGLYAVTAVLCAARSVRCLWEWLAYYASRRED